MNSGMLRTLFRPGRNATDRGLATVSLWSPYLRDHDMMTEYYQSKIIFDHMHVGHLHSKYKLK